jgi:hypothetical protein
MMFQLDLSYSDGHAKGSGRKRNVNKAKQLKGQVVDMGVEKDGMSLPVVHRCWLE